MDIYDKIGVRKIINAAGNLTTLGGSLMPPQVLEAMEEASRYYVDMFELQSKAGEMIAEVTGSEAALITNGAAAALTLATAACITGKDRSKMDRLPNTEGMRNEVIIQRGHRNPFDQAILAAGARFVVVGKPYNTCSRDIEEAINGKTAAISHFVHAEVTGLSLEEVLRIGKEKEVPIIVDAAAELPPVKNLRRFVEMGSDLVIFSGGKGIRGPQTSGILCGRRELVEAAAMQMSPNFGIGRSMKVGKEEIVGLLVALKLFLEGDHEEERRGWERKAQYIFKELSPLPGLKVAIVHPELAARPVIVPRIQLTLEEGFQDLTVQGLAEELRRGKPPIYVNTQLLPKGVILISPQCLLEGEEKLIVERIKEIL